MKTNTYRHGELILKEISALPKEVVLQKEVTREIVAHSETGHHHVLEAIKPFKVYTWNGETYLELTDIAKLWHQKTGNDVHTTHEIKPAIYQVVIKQAFDYFTGALARVRD